MPCSSLSRVRVGCWWWVCWLVVSGRAGRYVVWWTGAGLLPVGIEGCKVGRGQRAPGIRYEWAASAGTVCEAGDARGGV